MAVVRSGDADIDFEVHGDGDALLLIMGVGTDKRGWTMQLPAFAQRYRTIAYDNRGVGRSSAPSPPYSTEQMADDALAVMEAAGIERAHVVGVSMGGAIAQHLALKSPERVRSLVLAVTWPGPSPWRARVRELQRRVATLGREDLVRLRVLLVFSPPFVNENPDLLEPIEATMMQTPLHGYLAHIDACETHDLRARLGEIRTPTLAIAAARDVLVPPELTKEIAARIPSAELVTLDTAHAVQLEAAGDFNKLILDFLARH